MKTLQFVLGQVHETTDFEGVEFMDVNTKGLFENTPLHVTMTWRDEEAAEVLLSAGADVNAQGEYGFTPLQRAISANSSGLVFLLLSHGADPRIKNYDGDDAYSLARKIGNEYLLPPNLNN